MFQGFAWANLSLICFLGKVTETGSEIYSSQWKPWSYLTGSSDAESAATDSSNLTTQQTTTLTGFLIYYPLSYGVLNQFVSGRHTGLSRNELVLISSLTFFLL